MVWGGGVVVVVGAAWGSVGWGGGGGCVAGVWQVVCGVVAGGQGRVCTTTLHSIIIEVQCAEYIGASKRTRFRCVCNRT